MDDDTEQQVTEYFAMIVSQLPADASVTVDELVENVNQWYNNYHVGVNESIRRIARDVKTEYDITLLSPADFNEQEIAPLGAAYAHDEDDWVPITAEVQTTFELSATQRENGLLQRGVMRDETGRVLFSVWESAKDRPVTGPDGADLLPLAEGAVYTLRPIVVSQTPDVETLNETQTTQTDETSNIRDLLSVTVTSSTEIARTEDTFDFDIPSRARVSGTLTDIQSGSGIIHRCSHERCNRPLSDGACPDHDSTDGVPELRIKAVIDDGSHTFPVVFLRELVTDITGLTLDDAQEIISQTDQQELIYRFTDEIVGRRYTVIGREYRGDNITAEEVTRVDTDAIHDRATVFLETVPEPVKEQYFAADEQQSSTD